jgi:hypothetical protein
MMGIINGGCFTNMDGYEREYWPEKFVAVPKPGDRIMAKSRRELKVCGIIHCDRWYNDAAAGTPYIIIELTDLRWGLGGK